MRQKVPDVASMERERLIALADYDIVGSGPEQAYDAIVALAAELFAMPMCLITLVGQDALWIKAGKGVPVRTIPRHMTFCTQVVEQRGSMVVPDAADDPRFACNPLVLKDRVRFYAGALILGHTGTPLGTVCILDTVPHAGFGAHQLRLLEHLAALVSDRLESRRLARVERTARSFTDASQLAMLTTDRTGTILLWNPAAERMFGWSPDEIVGHNVSRIVPERFRAAHAAGLARLTEADPAGQRGRTLEVIAMRADGSEFPIQLSLSIWDGPQGAGIGAQIEDISVRRARETALEHLAEHDALTGLPNRRSFHDALARAVRDQGCAGVLAIDLDGFKAINDSLGHAVGDAFLQALAARLQIFAEGKGLLGRLGGDEFAFLVAGSDDLVRLREIAQQLCETIREPVPIAGHLLQVGASIGVAVAPLHGTDADELLVRADLAMFRSKREAGGSFRVFDAGMVRELSALRAFKQEIRRATTENEWVLHYQPQVDLASGRIIGVEALLRWRHPDRGLLAPKAFIDVLETHADAYRVGTWILDEACRALAHWRSAGAAIDCISVNLFATQLRAGDLGTIVPRTLARHGLRSNQLELELTETIALGQDVNMDAIARLHAQGVGIAFDDFGTGFASLSTLKRCPLTRLKIDRSFVQDITTERHSIAIVGGIVAIAHGLDLRVIAEGIETEQQRLALLGLGCDEAQGFHFGKPVPAADMLAMLLAKGREQAEYPPGRWSADHESGSRAIGIARR
jgi:diguanylate cyclase (GGDEF)-like protein/PAS domain S-box-containing protein